MAGAAENFNPRNRAGKPFPAHFLSLCIIGRHNTVLTVLFPIVEPAVRMLDRILNNTSHTMACDAERQGTVQLLPATAKYVFLHIMADSLRSLTRMIKPVIAQDQDLFPAPPAYIAFVTHLLLRNMRDFF